MSARKRGRLALVLAEGKYCTVREHQAGSNDLLRTVFEDVVVQKSWTFDEVREHAKL